MVAKDLVSNTVMPLVFKDTFKQGLSIMSFYHLRHLPVVDKKKFLGTVTEDDLLNFNQDDTIATLVKSESLKKIAALEDKHIYEIMQLMGDHKLTMIPVINSNEVYLGLITLEEIIKYFTESSSIAEPGCILVLTIKKRDYSLGEIARIVESENGSILNSSITYLPESDLIEVTLKLNKQEINPIVATFERYNYTVKASYSENDYYHLFQERYDHLMNYLNV
jgi:predicted transcriptional regulator